ncbi:MAG: DEAD/DEAH box helicase [Nanoarchaeota archaeon]
MVDRMDVSMAIRLASPELASLPLPEWFRQHYQRFSRLTPIQAKAIQAGLLEGKSLLCCAPTASGKTLVASMAIANVLPGKEMPPGKGKALYLLPLKALGHEKLRDYQELLSGTGYTVALALGELDSDSSYLGKYDLLLVTTEKLDSLLRHGLPWLQQVKLIIVDEIHLLHDPTRGPTLEVVLTLLRRLIQPQLIGLSATIGNPQELADWLDATLVQDSWRPVELQQGIHYEKTHFY